VWRDAQRSARGRLWPEVERFLSGLPPEPYRQAKLVEYDLALRYSETGQFRDIFLGPGEFPMLSVGGWLLDDMAPSKPGRLEAERRLFLASVLLAARTHLLASIPDEASFYDVGYNGLAEFFAERATTELRAVAPAEAPSERNGGGPTSQTHGADSGDGWSAPASIVASTALAYAGRSDLANPIGEILGELARAFQIRTELGSMQRDLLRGRTTYPVAFVAKAARIPLEPWPTPEVVLGAMALTRSLPAILEAAAAHVRESKHLAEAAGLSTFVAYLEDVSATFETEARLNSDRTSRPKPLIAKAEPTLPKALAMAHGFLLADPTFEESWEVHREGMFGAPEVTSRFPAGIVLEILTEQGLDLANSVDDFLAFTALNRFRYYDHPWADPDTDTIGAFLRLRPSSTDPEGHADALDSVLSCLDLATRANGAVPVWLQDCGGWEVDRPQVVALGEHCCTVVAHLVLGLAAASGPVADRYGDIAEIGGSQVCERICAVGLGANVNYPPNFALTVFFRLLSRVGAGRAEEARSLLDAHLVRASTTQPATPQDAALLTRACLAADRPDLIDPSWQTIILKRQAFDGGWNAEPFAAAPNRGSWLTWYSSRRLTSALCYDALARPVNAGRDAPVAALVHA
jgi:hypothetical protein